MKPDQLKTAGHRLYGRKKWKFKLAEALAVNVSTIHRIMQRPEIPGPYEVAIRGLLANKKAMDEAAALARKMGLVPRKRRKKVLVPKGKKPIRLRPAGAAARHEEKKVEKVRDRDVRPGDVGTVDPVASD